jgi:hypothetical protein
VGLRRRNENSRQSLKPLFFIVTLIAAIDLDQDRCRQNVLIVASST